MSSMAATAMPMIASWTVVNTIPAIRTGDGRGICRLKKLAPKMASRAFCRMRLTAMDTMIIPNSRVPCRTNGV